MLPFPPIPSTPTNNAHLQTIPMEQTNIASTGMLERVRTLEGRCLFPPENQFDALSFRPEVVTLGEKSQPDRDRIDLDWNRESSTSSSSSKLSLSTNSPLVARSLMEAFPSLSLELALQLVGDIRQIQDSLPEHYKDEIPPSDTFEHTIFIEKNAFHIKTDSTERGRGTYKRVFKVVTFTTKDFCEQGISRTLGQVETRALLVAKDARTHFSPQAKLIREAASPGAPVAPFLSTGKTLSTHQGMAFATCPLYDCTMDKIDYRLSETPVTDLLKNIRSVMQGAASFHRHGYLHRDIKAANTLARKAPNGSYEVVLNDYDLLCIGERKEHITTLSPEYGAPFIFGTNASNLLNQKRRRGFQTEAADLFAIAKMIEIDLLIPFFKQIGEYYNLDSNFSAQADSYNRGVEFEMIGRFSDEELRDYSNQFENRATYHTLANYRRGYAKLVFIHPHEARRQELHDIAVQLRDHLPVNEYAALRNLINATLDIQQNGQFMSMDEGIQILESFIEKGGPEPRRKVRKLVL